MRVLIVENEIYLAQSIGAKLGDFGFECEIVSSMSEALKSEDHEVVLLSTNIAGQDCYPIIEKYKESIVILMISYVSDDTVSKPLKAGAKDYILKPFMIDELVRKIEHYRAFQRLKKEAQFYRRYTEFSLAPYAITPSLKITPPFVLRASSQRQADAYALAYAKHKGLALELVVLGEGLWRERCRRCLASAEMVYVIGLETLKKSERKEFLEGVGEGCVVASFISSEELEFDAVVELGEGAKRPEVGGEILSLDDYIKNTILHYESKYPDTELSKRLGMSRKSLWEKRKKYGISKKK